MTNATNRVNAEDARPGRASPRRAAVICYHSSPVVQPGGRDAGGMNVYVRESSRELAARGWELDVFTRDDGNGPTVEVMSEGVRLIRVAAGPRRPVDKQKLYGHIGEFACAIAAFRLSQGLRYDIVHSHYWLSGVAGLTLQRRWDIPHLTMFHTLGEVKNRARSGEREPAQRIDAERSIAASATRVICATGHERELLRSLYQAPEGRFATIPCGVDVDRFKPLDKAAARRHLGFGDGGVLLYVGRLEPLKGIDIVIRAMAQLDAPRPLLVVAGGDQHSATEVRRLRAQASAAGVEDRVRFVGAVPQEELPEYYAAADVCVIPSFYESFGMAALEAQSCGRPVVASRVGGLPGVVRDGETGYLVPWRCPEPFAERLDVLLRNRALQRSFGAAAREWAMGFRWSSIAKRLAALYEATLTERALAGDCHPDHRVTPFPHVRCDVA